MYKLIIDTLVKIFNEDAYINTTINNEIKLNNFTGHDKKIYTKVVYGVVENKLLLDYYLQPFIKGKRVKPFMKNALRVGAYVITFMDLANHFIVDKIVSIVKKIDFNGSKFINGVLRNYERTPLRTLDNLNKYEQISIKYSIPLELVEYLYKDYPDFETIVPYLTKPIVKNSYRINGIKSNINEIKESLNVEYEILDDVIFTKESLIDSNLFKEGKIIPQDYSSTIPVRFLNPTHGDNVLDACSAPGSKTVQIADYMKNNGSITALDVHEHKIKLINENKEKYGASIINAVCQDSSKVSFSEPFDKILVDAPCSGLGVIGHKVDLKYKMTVEKIKEISQLSYSILNNVSRYLKENGTLVYSTCTITKIENELLIRKFLNEHSDFVLIEEKVVLPSETNFGDGFYICKLQRK